MGKTPKSQKLWQKDMLSEWLNIIVLHPSMNVIVKQHRRMQELPKHIVEQSFISEQNTSRKDCIDFDLYSAQPLYCNDNVVLSKPQYYYRYF